MEGAENIMSEERKSKAELLQELKALRQRICELEQANQAHQKFESQFKELFETTPVGIYRTTPDGRIIMANPALIQMLGYSSFEELSQRNLEKEGFTPGYPRSAFKDLIKKEGEVVGLESAWIRRDGSTLFVIENARAVRDESRKTLYYEGIVQDITEYKKTDQKRQQSENKYRTLLENLPQKIFLKDRSSVYISCNENYARDLNIKPEEIAGKTDYDFLPKELAEKYRVDDKRIIESGRTQTIEEKYIQDGQEIFVHTVKTPVKDDQGNVIGVLGIFWDITEQKKAEQKLRESEEKFRQVVSTTTDAIMLFEAETRQFVEVNKACEKLYGYSREEFLNLKQSDITAELKKSNESIEQTLKGKLFKIPIRYHRKKDGTVFPVEISAGTFELGGRRILCGVVRDITERIKAEEQIRKLSSAVEQSIDGIALVDLDSKLLYVNEAFARMHDYTPEEMIGMPVTKLHDREQMDVFNANKYQVRTRGYWEGEIWHIKKDGVSFPTYMSVTVLKDAEGQLNGILAVTRDITEQKRMEEALRESQRWQRAILDSIPDMAWLKDKESKYIAANEALCKAFGIKSEDFIGKTDLDISPKDLAERYRTDDQEIMKTGKRRRIEEQWGKKKGKRIWIETIKTPIYNDQGQVIGTSGIARDITEQKKAEEQLRKTRERLEYILATTPATTYTCKVGGDWPATFISENVRDQFGYEPHQLIEDTNFWPAHIHPDDRQLVLAGLSRLFESNFHVHEYRFLHKDGSYRWAHDEIRLIRDEKGKPIECIGYLTDITERKKAEQKLQESEEKYRQVVSTSTDAIMLFDAEKRRFVEVNKACEELYGYSREEFLNLKQSDITAEPEKTHESIEQTLEGKLYRIPIRYHIKKDGTVFPVEISAGTFELRGRRVLCGVIRDITERKKAEEKIRTLISAIEQSIDGIAITDMEPKLLYVNEAFARMHDYTPEEMIGMPVARLHSKEQMEQIIGGMHQVKTRGSKEGEIKHIKKDGTTFPTYMSVTLLKDNDGRPSGMLAVARDITELKQREKEFDDYRQKMARAEQLASLGTLGAGLAHELTQPLTVITLLIENVLTDMEKTEHPRSVADKLRDVLNEVSKVTSITKKFRSAVRKSSERVVRQVDLKAVAQRTIELFDESARQAKITLDITGLDKLPNIYSSVEEIEQLFFALVENAIQAACPTDEPLGRRADNEKDCRLVISGAVKDNYVELQFSDNCGGIAPENLDKIFEPFFTTKPIGEATGLGLCIAEHIVSRTGGKIHVESKLGEGTTFYFTLPIKSHEKFYPKYR